MDSQSKTTSKLFFHNADIETNVFPNIISFLQEEGIEFGTFELNDNAKQYHTVSSVPDEEREQLIKSFPEITEKYAHMQGYRSDVVCLYPEFEHLPFIMNMFGNVHYHFEHEYWYLFDGRLGFTFYSIRGFKFSVVVESGEYIQVPERIWQQCFFVDSNDRMKSMRFFTTSGTVKLPEINWTKNHECTI